MFLQLGYYTKEVSKNIARALGETMEEDDSDRTTQREKTRRNNDENKDS